MFIVVSTHRKVGTVCMSVFARASSQVSFFCVFVGGGGGGGGSPIGNFLLENKIQVVLPEENHLQQFYYLAWWIPNWWPITALCLDSFPLPWALHWRHTAVYLALLPEYQRQSSPPWQSVEGAGEMLMVARQTPSWNLHMLSPRSCVRTTWPCCPLLLAVKNWTVFGRWARCKPQAFLGNLHWTLFQGKY